MTKNILNHMEDSEEASFVYKGNYIFDDFKDLVKSVERIGKYEDPNGKLIDILIVRLEKEISLGQARTKQRNFIAKYLNGSRGGVFKDAALVVFVSPNEDDWRFSFVKMEYKFKENGRVKEEFTPARRYSFLVGTNENSHTAQSRFLPLLLDDEADPKLEDLEDAFSVETVTKEFFEKYRDLFLRLKESLDGIVEKNLKVKAEFEKKKVETVNFAKKLLSQVVFLYFLQKRGWFGVPGIKIWGEGDRKFLRNLFNNAEKENKNYFNMYLEPLFYEALRVERKEDNYERFNCRIPFLNGGLFDPINEYDWQDIDIEIPNDIFSNNRKTKEGDIGDGILDVFDRYNFTVKEDEPLEKEIAIDPEMLGKVFENLLEVRDRKSKGIYYTPREIVHYMCQESLANYLAAELNEKVKKEEIDTLIAYGESVVEHDSRVIMEGRETKYYSFKLSENIRKNAQLIDENLNKIRVCDPAVGSGAFLVGMMNEIVRTRNVLTPYIGENGERSPYHFKREAILNCLYGVDIDPGAVEIAKLRFWLSLIVDEDDRTKIQPLPNLDYKVVQGNSLLSVNKLFNSNLISKLEELKPLYFNETNISKKNEYHEQIEELIIQITNDRKDFDFEVYFSEVVSRKNGFDVVIANPPYVRQERIKQLKPLLSKEGYDVYNSTSDLYTYFYEKSCKILKKGGFFCIISSNKWMRAKYGEKLRKYLKDKTEVLNLIDFGGYSVFDATVDTNIILSKKGQPNEDHEIKYINISEKIDRDVISFIKDNLNSILQKKLSDSCWTLAGEKILKLKEKIERIGKPLKDWDVKIYRGVLTGLNEAFIITTEKRDEILANCKDEAERRRTEAIIKPILRGRDIKRYYYEWAELWVIIIPAGWTNLKRGPEDAKIYIENTFPSLMKYLKKFEDKARKRADQGDHWWELRHCAYYPEFEKEKVVWPRVAQQFSFSLVPKGAYILDSMAFMITDNSKYVLSILNTRLVDFFVKTYVHQLSNTGFLLSNQYVERIPIPKIPELDQKPFIELADKILIIEETDPNADTSELESQIDHIVYQLYGLTEEEIKIVEGRS